MSRIKRELRQFRKIGWRGILIGFLLSVLIAPLLSPFVAPMYTSLRLFATPNFETSVEVVDSPYSPGQRAGKFGNITWEKGYEVYRVQFRQTGGPSVDRAVFEVRFPGCVRQASGFGEGNGEITATNPLRAEVYTTNRTDAEVLGCTVQISTQSIYPHEGYTLEFVIDHTPDHCDLLSAYNPNRQYFVDYHWSSHGTQLSGRVVGDIQGAEEYFDQMLLPANSTKLVQKEDYQAYIVGAGHGNESKAKEECFR